MRNVAQRSKEEKWIASLRPHEHQKPGSVVALTLVSLPGRRVFARRALRLPMKASWANCKVLVPGRGREGLLRLIKGHEEKFSIDRVKPETTRLRVARPNKFREPEPNQHFVTHILAVEEDRAVIHNRFFVRVELDAIEVARCRVPETRYSLKRSA